MLVLFSITHKKNVPIVVKTKISIRKKIVAIVSIVFKTNARKKASLLSLKQTQERKRKLIVVKKNSRNKNIKCL